MLALRVVRLRALLPAALVLAAPAYAQKAGTYSGTNNEGYTIEVVVAGSKGNFAITGVSDSANVYCGKTEIGGWGLGIGTNDPLNGHKGTLNINDTTIWYQGYFDFTGNTVKVKQEFEVPVLSGTGSPPKKACAAKTGYITTTLTYGGDATRAPGPTVVRADPLKTP
jgi:hypothetical protein